MLLYCRVLLELHIVTSIWPMRWNEILPFFLDSHGIGKTVKWKDEDEVIHGTKTGNRTQVPKELFAEFAVMGNKRKPKPKGIFMSGPSLH